MYEAIISIISFNDVLVFCSFKNLSNISLETGTKKSLLDSTSWSFQDFDEAFSFLFFSFFLTGSEQTEAQHTNGFTELHIITEVSHCYWIKRSSLILF